MLSTGGAVRRVTPDATAFPHRTASWLISIPASWRSPAQTPAEVQWVRDTFAALQPLCAGGAYVNFMDRDEPTAGGSAFHGAARRRGAETAYGGTLQRLRVVLAEYDPDNVFRLNQNITPGTQS